MMELYKYIPQMIIDDTRPITNKKAEQGNSAIKSTLPKLAAEVIGATAFLSVSNQVAATTSKRPSMANSLTLKMTRP